MDIPTRAQIVRWADDAGIPVAAVLPIHYPRELLRACGFHPMEVWGPVGVDTTASSAHFQAYTCAIVHNATSFLMSGRLDVASVVLIPHACDSLQGMASVLQDFVETLQPVHTLYLPRGGRPSDAQFLEAELRRLGGALAAHSGASLTDDALGAALETEEEADQEHAALALGRDRIALDDRSFFTLLRSREYLPCNRFVELARSAPRGEPPADGAVRIMLSGIVPEPMELFDHLAHAGARVVADDLACCSRRIYPTGTTGDPWRRMVRRLLGSPPDPTRGTAIAERARALVRRMREHQARGLLVYDPKFCEPELFDLPILRQRLEAEGLSLLHVEVDLAGTLSQQAMTRMEAFVEMLR